MLYNMTTKPWDAVVRAQNLPPVMEEGACACTGPGIQSEQRRRKRAPGFPFPCQHPAKPSCPQVMADVFPWGGGGSMSSWRSQSSPVQPP